MNNYLVYEKRECIGCKGTGIGLRSETVAMRCHTCGGMGYHKIETSLEDAIRNLLANGDLALHAHIDLTPKATV